MTGVAALSTTPPRTITVSGDDATPVTVTVSVSSSADPIYGSLAPVTASVRVVADPVITTDPPTTTAPVTTTAPPTITVGPSTTTPLAPLGPLPATGSSPASILAVALVALLIGAVTTVVARRRPT